jgi:arginine-tRNA-protein transferase
MEDSHDADEPTLKEGQIAYCGIGGGPCGYCRSGEDTFVTETVFATCIPASIYQQLADTTWRRCGLSIYRPIYHMICCEPYTIRLDVAEHMPNASQRKMLRRFGRQFASIEPPNEGLLGWLESYVSGNVDSSLKITLERASFDQESFELYKKYQVSRHDDKEDDLTTSRYTNFLVKSCIKPEDPYGTFHQKWRYKGKLFAVGVLDILVNCVSSVYFYHDPDMSKWSLGTVSAMLEICLTRYLKLTYPSLRYYYLGYYIDNCSKMRYKADFRPSMILDPRTMAWVSMDSAKATFLS